MPQRVGFAAREGRPERQRGGRGVMMDLFYALLLSGLEMTFIWVGLCLLHSQRKALGSASFYLALGLIFLFAQFVCATDLRVIIGGSLNFQVGQTVLFLPYLAALLLVYITDGTLAAQRLIIGSMIMFGLFLYLCEITRLQFEWTGFSITADASAETLDFMLRESRRSMVALALAHLLDLFMLPVIFTRLKNVGCRLFVCIFGALSFTLIADSILYALVINWSQKNQIWIISGSLLARTGAMFFLSILLTVYLKKIESEGAEKDGDARSPLDIFFAFLGGYSRSKVLEESIREWEGRYQQILSNASEIIVLLTPSGRVVDANNAAARVFSMPSPGEMTGMKLFQWMHDLDGKALQLDIPREFDHLSTGEFFRNFRAIVGSTQIENARQMACSLTLQMLKNRPVLVLIGRDETEEMKLAAEKERLSEQLVHAQRIESLGQLAGGIAHDFNNHLHAILGHIDVINLMHSPSDPEIVRHLDKIAEIAEQSGKLTSQLLGFARKGKYQIVDVNLNELVESSLGLLMPKSRRHLTVDFTAPAEKFIVRGDRVQLQQVLLNLMLNAADAMAETEGAHVLTLAIGNAVDAPVVPDLPHDFTPDGEYCFIMVKDNGSGIDEETKKKIFEPFFTTKPVGEGTGMGLAMVYGTVTAHKGFVQLESSLGNGAAFFVFLPKALPTDTAKISMSDRWSALGNGE